MEISYTNANYIPISDLFGMIKILDIYGSCPILCMLCRLQKNKAHKFLIQTSRNRRKINWVLIKIVTELFTHLLEKKMEVPISPSPAKTTELTASIC